MLSTEPTVEDMEELARSFEQDEMYEREEICRLCAEEEEAERDRECRREGFGYSSSGPEFDCMEDAENLPD
jgi:hypothetical protein